MTFEESYNKRLSVLVIGASGGTGQEIMKKLYTNPRKPEVHAFSRDPSKLTGNVGGTYYHSSIQGDARDTQDLTRALKFSVADVVVLSVGNGASSTKRKSNVRTASARALEQVLKKPQFQHVRVVVVSSQGAGNSRINIGFGMGTLVGFHLRHALKDHTGQEQAFLLGDLRNRTFIVRPTTSLVNDPTSTTTKMIEWSSTEKSPASSRKMDRSDLARYIAEKICREEDHHVLDDNSSFGNIVHLSCARR